MLSIHLSIYLYIYIPCMAALFLKMLDKSYPKPTYFAFDLSRQLVIAELPKSKTPW